MQHLTGINAAVFTALHDDGSINPSAIERQASSALLNGLAGVFVCGTTGEGMSLSVAERFQIAERWMSVAGRQMQVIVHVGAHSLTDARALAAHAEAIGAKAIAAVLPTFFKPTHLDDMVAFNARVAAAAPYTPYFYYHIPSMTGIKIPVQQFLIHASGRIPTLAGAKFTYDDMDDLGACCRMTRPDGQAYNMLIGRDESLLAARQNGAQGAIGSTYNIIAPLHMQLLAAYERNDLAAAQAAQAQVHAIATIMNKYGGFAAGKAMMKMIGLDLGPTRLPVHTLSLEERSALENELNMVGFFEVCSKV
jgi:N-acetylneuraminate lyase